MAKPRLPATVRDALTEAGYEDMNQVRNEDVSTLRRKVGGDIADDVVAYFMRCNDQEITGVEHAEYKLAQPAQEEDGE